MMYQSLGAYSTHSYSNLLTRSYTHMQTHFFSFLLGVYLSLLRRTKKMCDWFYPIQTRLNVKFLYSVWLVGRCVHKGREEKKTQQNEERKQSLFSHRCRLFFFPLLHFFVFFCFGLLCFPFISFRSTPFQFYVSHTKHFLHESFHAFFLFCGFLFIEKEEKNRQPQTHININKYVWM